jgi:uncharacterized protein (DUF433 family)
MVGVAEELDWGRFPLARRDPLRVSGAWTLGESRLPLSSITDNWDGGSSVEEIAAMFDVAAEDVRAVLEFRERLLADPARP